MTTLPVFEKFIRDLRAIWAATSDNAARMAQARLLMERLIHEEALIAHSKGWPFTVGQNLLFYEDEEYNFVVNAVVRPPGYVGSVHDHAHAWVLYGVMDGQERLERYDRLDDGKRPDYAELRLASDTKGERGKVDLVPPFAIHAERGGPLRSVAMILRTERLVGRIMQHGYDPKTNAVKEMWGPKQVPYALEVAT
jgi:predicted metal-dependent enzyme (double-stranded beta helix superfamily)